MVYIIDWSFQNTVFVINQFKQIKITHGVPSKNNFHFIKLQVFSQQKSPPQIFFKEFRQVLKSRSSLEELRFGDTNIFPPGYDVRWKYMKQSKGVQYQKQPSKVYCRKDVLRNFAKFTGKHQSFFFDKVSGLRPATLLKKRCWYRSFPVSFAKFLRTPFFKEHLWWLLLNILRTFNLGPVSWGYKQQI